MDKFVEKLTAEKEKAKIVPEPIIDWIYEQGVENESFRAQFMQDTKSLSRLWDYTTKKARSLAQNNGTGNVGVCVDGDTLLGWTRDYYALDDAEEARKEAENKKAAKEAEEKRKAEAAAKAKNKVNVVPTKTKYSASTARQGDTPKDDTTTQTAIAVKKKNAIPDGQLSFDALFGGSGS